MQKVNPSLRVLLLAMYGNNIVETIGTPIDFDPAMGLWLDDLRLQRDEFNRVAADLTNLAKSLDVTASTNFPDTVLGAIFNITLEHPGFVRLTFYKLHVEYRRGLTGAPETLRYLLSAEYRDSVQDSRAIGWVCQREFDKDETKFLRRALYEMDSTSTLPVQTEV